jgi:hypothetical protein
MKHEGYTVTELAEKTGKTRHAVESWLSLHKIKPLSYEAIYPSEILDRLKEARRGRPAKTPADQEPPPETSNGEGER